MFLPDSEWSPVSLHDAGVQFSAAGCSTPPNGFLLAMAHSGFSVSPLQRPIVGDGITVVSRDTEGDSARPTAVCKELAVLEPSRDSVSTLSAMATT